LGLARAIADEAGRPDLVGLARRIVMRSGKHLFNFRAPHFIEIAGHSDFALQKSNPAPLDAFRRVDRCDFDDWLARLGDDGWLASRRLFHEARQVSFGSALIVGAVSSVRFTKTVVLQYGFSLSRS
jgi:hypothetical protein